MTAFLDILTLTLPLAGGYGLASLGTPWGVVVAVLSLLFASACQGAAQLYRDPWDAFHGIEGDD
jgi:hypothetical protein